MEIVASIYDFVVEHNDDLALSDHDDSIDFYDALELKLLDRPS